MTLKHSLFASLLGLAGLLSLAGCLDCSQAGCTAQLHVDIAVPSSDALSLEFCRDGSCYGPTALTADSFETLLHSDALFVQAGIYDGNLTFDATEFDDRMSLDHPPADVPWIVRVRDGSDMLLEQTIVPSYAVSYPNGEACGPTCYNASHTLSAQ